VENNTSKSDGSMSPSQVQFGHILTLSYLQPRVNKIDHLHIVAHLRAKNGLPQLKRQQITFLHSSTLYTNTAPVISCRKSWNKNTSSTVSQTLLKSRLKNVLVHYPLQNIAPSPVTSPWSHWLSLNSHECISHRAIWSRLATVNSVTNNRHVMPLTLIFDLCPLLHCRDS
jgi:hypothetical protein